MADPPPHPDVGGTGEGPDRGSPPGAPRWVKMSGIIALALLLLFVILHLTGNSLGGPGHHAPPGGHGVQGP